MVVKTEICHRCGGSGEDPAYDLPCRACTGHGVECWRKVPCPDAVLKKTIVVPHTEEV